MGISIEDRRNIAKWLSNKTGIPWKSNVDGVYCSTIIQAQDRFKGEINFKNFLTNNKIPAPDTVDSSIREMGLGNVKIDAKFTSNTKLLSLLKKFSPPSMDQTQTRIERENAEIAYMLSTKTGIPWKSNVDRVYCSYDIVESDRIRGENTFKTELKDKAIPIPNKVDSSLNVARNITRVEAAFTSASVLNVLLQSVHAAEKKTASGESPYVRKNPSGVNNYVTKVVPQTLTNMPDIIQESSSTNNIWAGKLETMDPSNETKVPVERISDECNVLIGKISTHISELESRSRTEREDVKLKALKILRVDLKSNKYNGFNDFLKAHNQGEHSISATEKSHIKAGVFSHKTKDLFDEADNITKTPTRGP